MNIAENILKHSLQNVYFLVGTALAGKTTMVHEISKKHGFIPLIDNYHEDCFKEFRSVCNDKYQPQSTKKKEIIDWEAYFNRTVEEFLADRDDYSENDEYIEFILIELIKLSQNNKVITDICIPFKLLTEISDYNRIACLLASPEMVTCENYGKREDHREFLECIKSLNEPNKKLAVQDELFKIDVEKTYEDALQYGLFTIVRTDSSTIPDTLDILEKHFNL